MDEHREDRDLLRHLWRFSGSSLPFKDWRKEGLVRMLQCRQRKSAEHARQAEEKRQQQSNEWQRWWDDQVALEASSDQAWQTWHAQQKQRWQAAWEKKRKHDDRTDLDELLEKSAASGSSSKPW